MKGRRRGRLSCRMRRSENCWRYAHHIPLGSRWEKGQSRHCHAQTRVVARERPFQAELLNPGFSREFCKENMLQGPRISRNPLSWDGLSEDPIDWLGQVLTPGYPCGSINVQGDPRYSAPFMADSSPERRELSKQRGPCGDGRYQQACLIDIRAGRRLFGIRKESTQFVPRTAFAHGRFYSSSKIVHNNASCKIIPFCKVPPPLLFPRPAPSISLRDDSTSASLIKPLLWQSKLDMIPDEAPSLTLRQRIKSKRNQDKRRACIQRSALLCKCLHNYYVVISLSRLLGRD